MRPQLVYSKPAESAPSVSEVSDAELLRRLRNSDESALDELVDRKSRALLHLAYKVVADREEARDVVQMAFVRIWEHRDRYDERWSPNTWIYRITTNLAIDHLRSRQSKERQREPLKVHLRQSQEGSARRLLGDLREKEVEQIFLRLAEHLTEKQRSIFVLREMEGLSTPDIAEIMQCRESTVRNHLFNARKVLRVELLQRYPEYAPESSSSSSGGSA